MAAQRIIGGCKVIHGDCIEAMRQAKANGSVVHAIVTDPPYHLSTVKRFGKPGSAPPTSDGETGVYKRAAKGFMGKQWDGGGVAFDPETWRAAYDLLPPGGHLVAFSSSRTYHRMACAIEDAGFEIRDQLMWLYGSGFPKSHDVSKGIDKAAGAKREVVGQHSNPAGNKPGGNSLNMSVVGMPSTADITVPATDPAKQWEGWGTALKPAHEPIVLARKPLEGTVAANVQEHGTGAVNVDACRVATDELTPRNNKNTVTLLKKGFEGTPKTIEPSTLGRWPANVVHDGSDEVEEAFAKYGDKGGGGYGTPRSGKRNMSFGMGPSGQTGFGDSGSAARFFYCAKATKKERDGSKHPTVKPVALMRWLVRMVTPPGGVVLDPFAGTGTTGQAAIEEGFRCVLVEADEESIGDIVKRLESVSPGARPVRKRTRP